MSDKNNPYVVYKCTLDDVELPQPFTIMQYEEFLDIHGRHFDLISADDWYASEVERTKGNTGP